MLSTIAREKRARSEKTDRAPTPRGSTPESLSSIGERYASRAGIKDKDSGVQRRFSFMRRRRITKGRYHMPYLTAKASGRPLRRAATRWSVNVSVACLLALLAGTARGDAGHTPLRLTSSFRPAVSGAFHPGIAHPALFGAIEVKAADLSAFTKWTSMMRRFNAQTKSRSVATSVRAWQALLESLRHKSRRDKMASVNDYINSVAYVSDSSNYGISDYWATPAEFLSRGGDCEDYAIAKYASLRALGFLPDQLRVTVVRDKAANITHVMLVVYDDGGAFILDSLEKRIRRMEDVTRYQATFSLNSQNWWRYRAARTI